MSAIRIGTSGWTYNSWRGPFYPPEVVKKNWLSWYAERFSTVEINGSFYRTPALKAVRGWRDATPDGFVFAWKASRFITHWKRLSAECRNSLDLMETRLKALGTKAGPVLFQLPARFKADRERLAAFVKLLAPRRRYAFEFRDTSWYEPAILDVLRDRNMGFCISDHHDAPAPWDVTADFVYVRGHGPTGEYKDHYTGQALGHWARRFLHWRRKKLSVYCYFDNDQKSAAPQDARKLNELLTQNQ